MVLGVNEIEKIRMSSQANHNSDKDFDARRGEAVDCSEEGEVIGGDAKRIVCRHEDMSYHIAKSQEEVVRAWRLVYHNYLNIGIVHENPYRIHCSKQAADKESVVVYGQLGGEVVCSLTIINDHPVDGLPLDAVYGKTLDALRSEGKELIEIGLLADRRKQVTRTLHSLLEMMHYVFHYAYRGQKTLVIGVHPRHAKFYQHSFGFEVLGEETTHPSVKDNPVVYLGLDWYKPMAVEKPLKQLVKYAKNVIEPEAFMGRYHFSEPKDYACPIRDYLADQYEKGDSDSDVAA